MSKESILAILKVTQFIIKQKTPQRHQKTPRGFQKTISILYERNSNSNHQSPIHQSLSHQIHTAIHKSRQIRTLQHSLLK